MRVLLVDADPEFTKELARELGAQGIEAVIADQGRSALQRHVDVDVVVLSQPVPAPRARAAGRLSEREQEVIELIAQACTNAQIARRLGIAEGTVKRHVNNIFIKLDAVSRLDAVNKSRKIHLY